MDFELPGTGVHVITAANGSGKTTLMHCIERLANSRVFNENFIQHDSWNVDSFARSSITYKSRGNSEITYTYRENSDSWRPTSQTAHAITEFGYDNVVAIPTLGNRVYVQKQKIGGGNVKAAPNDFRSALATILENDKFQRLLKFNLGELRGRGGGNRRKNIAFLLPKGYETRNGRRTQTYYSESSFSLGEIFTLNLVYELETISDNSLLVIDELEVALHPRVQINLLNYLESKANEKNLTVLISTHSSSIIKCAKNLIYLQSIGNGDVTVHYDCYPAMALQKVSVEEDLQPDYVFFVEDAAAEYYLREKIKHYFRINPERHQPLWKILPIGGYPEVLRFLKRAHQYLIHKRIGQYAFFDQDVQATKNDLRAKGNNRTDSENELWQLFNSQQTKTKFLTITPELGLWDWINQDIVVCQNWINQRIPDGIINMRDILRDCLNANPNNAANPRINAKNKITWICHELSTRLNKDAKRVKQNLFGAFADCKYNDEANHPQLNQLFGPIFNN